MSIQQERLKMTQQSDAAKTRGEEAPQLQFNTSTDESLAAFWSVLGGAALGVGLTVLILLIFNNGTLRFVGNTPSIVRIDENLGALSYNVDLLAERLGGLETSVVALDGVLAEQGLELAEMDALMGQLDNTRQNFDTFMSALAAALTEIGAVPGPAEAPAAEAAAPVEAVAAEEAAVEVVAAEAAPAEEAAPVIVEEISGPIPFVASVADLTPDAVQVFAFVDANNNSMLDAGEVVAVGATISLISAEGEAISAEMTEAGALFEGLAAGAYTVSVEDAAGYSLVSNDSAEITVAEEGEGKAIYFVVAE
jgi:hypothetical protein